MVGGLVLKSFGLCDWRRATWLLSWGIIVLGLAGCGGGSPASPDSPVLRTTDELQNVRLQVRLVDARAVSFQAETGTDFRLVRAFLNREGVSIQEVETEVSPEAESSNLLFSRVEPGNYLVVVQGFDEEGVLLGESNASIQVLSGQVSRVSLILRAGQVEPPPPPPLDFGYFVRQGATGTGLRVDDPAGSLGQVLGLYALEPRDFIFIFHAPQPLLVPGITQLPEGLTLIGEAAGLEIAGRGIDEELLAQISIPAGEPPEVVANFQVGSESLLTGFACRAGAEGPIFDLRGRDQVRLELMVIDGTGPGEEGAAVNFEDFRGLLELSEVRFRDFGTTQNSFMGTFEQGVAMLRIRGCEFSGRFALEGQGATEVNLDCQDSSFSGLIDVFLQDQTTGLLLFRENEFFAPPGLQERILVSLLGDSVDGRVHFLGNTFRNYSLTSTGAGGTREWAWIGNFFEVLDSTEAKLSMNFNGGVSTVVFHQNRLGPSDPIEVPIPSDLEFTFPNQAEAQIRVSENEFFGSFFVDVGLGGSLDLGVLDNSEYQDPENIGQFQLFLVAPAGGQRLCSLITGNTLTNMFLSAFGPDVFEVEVEETDVQNALSNTNDVQLNLNVDPDVEPVLTPGACVFPEAAVLPIVFSFSE